MTRIPPKIVNFKDLVGKGPDPDREDPPNEIFVPMANLIFLAKQYYDQKIKMFW